MIVIVIVIVIVFVFVFVIVIVIVIVYVYDCDCDCVCVCVCVCVCYHIIITRCGVRKCIECLLINVGSVLFSADECDWIRTYTDSTMIS